MCNQCGGTKTVWVVAGSIAQCQPCLKCNKVNKDSLETIKKLFELKEG